MDLSFDMDGIFYVLTYIYKFPDNFPYPDRDARHQTMNIGTVRHHSPVFSEFQSDFSRLQLLNHIAGDSPQ